VDVNHSDKSDGKIVEARKLAMQLSFEK